MACLLDLSHEILHGILINVEPADIGSLNQTCSGLNAYVRGNKLLHKEIYLQNWDHPASAGEPSWDSELQKVVTMQKLFECEDLEVKRAAFATVAATLVPFLSATTSVLNIPWLAAYFTAQGNIDAFLAASNLFQNAGTTSQKPAASPELRQLSAKLHCLYGVPIDADDSPSLEDDRNSSRFHVPFPLASSIYPHARITRSQNANIATHRYARSLVYDLRRYTEGSMWGPFKDDGSGDVDWEKVEAIMVVLGYNLRQFCTRARGLFQPMWNNPWEGVCPNSFASMSQSKIEKEIVPGSLEERDPFGITGTWMRVVCFLDYHDLYAFNFATQIPEDQMRPPIGTREAIRLIRLKLWVTKISPPGEDDGQDYPVVSFRGRSWSLHSSWDPNANSRIRGEVRQTREGAIRWTTWSIFHGEERWRSEGVQIGGIKSARGILGNWFDKDYDIHGPAGPTAFWKISDEVEDSEVAGLSGDREEDEEEDDDDDDDDEFVDDVDQEGEEETEVEEGEEIVVLEEGEEIMILDGQSALEIENDPEARSLFFFDLNNGVGVREGEIITTEEGATGHDASHGDMPALLVVDESAGQEVTEEEGAI